MHRRHFSARLAAAGISLTVSIAPSAEAQGAPVEGKQYVRLNQPQAAGSAGKIEVVEFFWYGCPHCNAFEPSLDAWRQKLPADVQFRRIPVAFREEPFVAHQRIFYALEAMGKLEALHRKVFYAIHNNRQRLDQPADIAAFMARNGIDAAAFLANYNAFSVQTKARQARQVSEAYKIDGVPSLGIQGRYYTSGTLAGTLDASLAVTDYLIDRVRRGQ